MNVVNLAHNSGPNQSPVGPAGTARRRFPSQIEFVAIRYGADTLMDSASWALRARPRALRNVRRKYTRFCVELLRAIGRASREPRNANERAA